MLSVVETAVETEQEVLTSAAQSEDAGVDEAKVETELGFEVEILWAEHQRVNATKKTSAAELRRIRQELGRKLFECKQLLARPGRGGEWSSWLKDRGISRATADRWVNRYAESIGQSDNRLTDAIPAEDAIEKLLNDFVKKTKPLLPGDHDRYRFSYRFTKKLGLQVEEEDESGWRGSFSSVTKPVQKIDDFVPHYNRKREPSLWTATSRFHPSEDRPTVLTLSGP